MQPQQHIIDAAARNDLTTVAGFIDDDPELVNAADEKDFTLLHMAARDGNLRLALLLINRGADVDTVDGEHRASSLGWAAFFGRAEMVEILIDAGANPLQPNVHGLTPRQCAEHGKAGHWKQAAPHATESDYQSIIDQLANYCDECGTENGF